MKRIKKTWGSFDREKGRKKALQALRSLRRVRRQMASDASVSELSANQLEYGLDSLEGLIGHVLPAPEAISQANLNDQFEERE
jgi:hypothetical protein